jgi:hypothetical protein
LTAEEFFTRFQNRRCELVKGQVRDGEQFSLDQELVIPEILPGFRVAVRRFFEGSSP